MRELLELHFFFFSDTFILDKNYMLDETSTNNIKQWPFLNWLQNINILFSCQQTVLRGKVASPLFLCSSHLDADIRGTQKTEKSFKWISKLFEMHKHYKMIIYLFTKQIFTHIFKIVFIKLLLYMHWHDYPHTVYWSLIPKCWLLSHAINRLLNYLLGSQWRWSRLRCLYL